tara:strand:- start:10323 stop:12065 length:1743 start_codon:yes stop_codon:yes gene_type:complete
MSKKFNLITNFKSLWLIMSEKERKKSIIFLFFTFVQVFLETISIGSLYPLLLSIFNSQKNIFSNDLLSSDIFRQIMSIENQILFFSFLILFVFIIKNIFLIFLVHWTQTFERQVKVRLKKHLLKSYLNNDYSFHVNSDTAKLVRNINTSTGTMMQSIRSSMMFINDFSLTIVLLLFMVTINPVLVFYSAITISILTFIYFIFFKRILIKYGKFSFEHEGESLKRLMQSFLLIKEIKLFQKENYFINFFHSEEKLFQEFQRKAFIIRSYPRVFFELIFVFGILAFINIKIFNSTETISEILPKTALLAVILIRMIPSLNRITSSAQKINQYQKSNDEIVEELKVNIIENQKSETDYVEKNNYKFENISLRNINFKYPKKENFLFKNLNLEIKKGSYLGIVGPSGCGKSTLIDIITGLTKINSGTIKINNEKADLESKKWKNLFGYVPQIVNLFNDTIYTNVTFETEKEKIDVKKIDDVICKAGLKNFINELDDGIFTKVGEFGYKISGGEKQRISIARALYKDPQILIFDESFNSLDRFTKQNILKEIKSLSKFKTIIIISHILEDLKDCDKIIDLLKDIS